MRRKRAAIALTLVVAAFAVGAPVLLAIHEAERQGRADTEVRRGPMMPWHASWFHAM